MTLSFILMDALILLSHPLLYASDPVAYTVIWEKWLHRCEGSKSRPFGSRPGPWVPSAEEFWGSRERGQRKWVIAFYTVLHSSSHSIPSPTIPQIYELLQHGSDSNLCESSRGKNSEHELQVHSQWPRTQSRDPLLCGKNVIKKKKN